MVDSKKSEMDVDISQISSHSMEECEKKCGKYSRYYTIAMLTICSLSIKKRRHVNEIFKGRT